MIIAVLMVSRAIWNGLAGWWYVCENRVVWQWFGSGVVLHSHTTRLSHTFLEVDWLASSFFLW